MLFGREHNHKNKITNLAIILLALCAAGYCVVYLFDHREEAAASETYQVVMSDGVISEQEEKMEDPYEKAFLPLRVLVKSDQYDREVSLYAAEGVCYAFLPAYAKMEELSYVFDDAAYDIVLSGRRIVSGETITGLETETDYEIEIKAEGQESLCYTMVFLQSRNLPTVFIDTQSGSMDYVDAYKGNEESGKFLCITAEGKLDSESDMERIKGRGNTSWDGIGAKNQYNVRLRDNTDILHMGGAQNWVIQANRLDVSMMRNKLAYDFARDLKVPYAVECEFADLYFNGNYMGTYLICEKVEMAANRVDLSNGCLLEANFREEDPDRTIATPYGVFVINSPEEVTREQYESIGEFLDETSASLAEAERNEAYADYIDVNSFAKLFVMNEIANDPDANLLSTFYYKENLTDAAKLTAGPVWDYDLAFGNEERGENPLISAFGESWFRELYKSERFRAEVTAVLKDFRKDCGNKYEEAYFENMKQYLEQSYHMNEVRWGEKEGYVASLYPAYEETIGYLRDYFAARFRNLQEVFVEPGGKHKVNFTKDGQTTHIFVEDGEKIPASVLESMGYYWSEEVFQLTDGQQVDPEQYRIYGDVSLRCRAGGYEGRPVLGEGAGSAVAEPCGREKGDLTMQWISFIMLMVPGLLSVWISGNTNLDKKNAFAILSQYFLNSFLVLLLAYGIFYVLYGSVILSFSDVYNEAHDYSIYNINMAFKYLLLAGGLAVAVGVVERAVIGIMRKQKLTKE